LRWVFPLRGCAWSDGVWYWDDWAFYGFPCLDYAGLLGMNLGTGQRALAAFSEFYGVSGLFCCMYSACMNCFNLNG